MTAGICTLDEGGRREDCAAWPACQCGVPTPKHQRRNTTACFVPTTADPQEVDLMRKVLHVHCDRKDVPGHHCRGALTIRHGSITLQCPLCGDARKKLATEAERVE